MDRSRIIGSVLLLVGTSVGAGILALPMVSASSGLLISTFLMLGIWLVTTITALLILEISLSFPPRNGTFSSLAYNTLGRYWQIATWFSVLLLFYSLLGAYTAGGSALISSLVLSIFNINLPSWVGTIIFVLTLGSIVFWGTEATDYTNRLLITIKGLLLIASIFLLLPYIESNKISIHEHFQNFKSIGAAAPIFLCAFGFHGSIPSIRIYVGDNRAVLRTILVCASTIPLIIYLLWLLGTLGTVPLFGEKNSFFAIKASGNSVAHLLKSISAIIKNSWVTSAINSFSSISMTTSFLGVSIGLFDFLADGFKRPNNRTGRLQTAFLTFFFPLVFALYYPKGFVVALGYAAIFLAFFALILPALMGYKIRKKARPTMANKFLFSRTLLTTIILVGVAIILLQLLSSFNLITT